ncbi:protein PIGBOS1 [Brachionichthys hirsutus]|uniref:protein PIGBOS1 n=1 Tax=Brachionichthys hirsutus TaxID=412623 RepID=UPI0036051FAA
MLRRRIPFSQVVLATLLGVGGGVYIYRPYFDPRLKTSAQQGHGTQTAQRETDNSSQSLLPASPPQAEAAGLMEPKTRPA